MARSYEDGETFPYRGRIFSLRTAPAVDGSRAGGTRVSLDGDCLILTCAPGDDRRSFLLFWYTNETEKIVRSLLPEWSKRLSVRPRSAGVKFARTRWGSCSSAGKLFFNSRLSMLSDDVGEYIVVHELCHLKHMNHSRAFWDAVTLALPSCKALRRKLRMEERNAGL
jgi:predicted metal-dependent hydrolase